MLRHNFINWNYALLFVLYHDRQFSALDKTIPDLTSLNYFELLTVCIKIMFAIYYVFTFMQ
jgi:hypothetical protein